MESKNGVATNNANLIHESEAKLSLSDLKAEVAKTNDLSPYIFKGKGQIDENIYEALPSLLKDICMKMLDKQEKEIALLGSISVISGLLPNYKGKYDGKSISANLYFMLLGSYGSGKGTLPLCRILGKKIHDFKKASFQNAMQQYEVEREQWENNKNGTLPEEPCQQMLYIPANISGSGLKMILAQNHEEGIMFETELDTLTNATKVDIGQFTSLLRAAFHHETDSAFRKTNQEYTELENPRLTLVLSGTYDQLYRLMPSIENGLFSRFMYYELDANPAFRNVFDPVRNDYEKVFEEKSKVLLDLYETLNLKEEPILFSFTEEQKADFNQFFSKLKKDLGQSFKEEIFGNVNRLGVIFFRIAMVFSILRAEEHELSKSDLLCADEDYSTTKSLIHTIIANTLSVFLKYTSIYSIDEENKIKKKAKQLDLVLGLSKNGWLQKDIAKQLSISESTVSRMLRDTKAKSMMTR
jgi:hypothetical protein